MVTGLAVAPSWSYGATPTPTYHPSGSVVHMTAMERRIAHDIKSLLKSASVPLSLDIRLVDAARRLVHGTRPVRSAVSNAGLSDAFVIPLRYTISTMDRSGVSLDTIAPVRALLTKNVRTTPVTHFGVGVDSSGPQKKVGLVFVRRRVQVSRFPRYLVLGDRYLLTARLEPGLRNPTILLASPSLRVKEIRPRHQYRNIWATIPFSDGRGRYTIEIQAADKYGSHVLSLMEVYVGEDNSPKMAPVVRLQPAIQPVTTQAEAEQRLLSLINRVRKRAGLRRLKESRVLQTEARNHCSDMATGSYFGHVSPTRGGLAQRLRKNGITAALALENIAISPNPDAAHFELMRSPSHLRNIIDPHVTHVGVGAHRSTASHNAIFTFTQVFARLR